MQNREINKGRSRHLYRVLAPWYNQLHHLQTLWADTLHRRRVASLVEAHKLSICLDIGCGTGLSIIELARVNSKFRIIGLDHSESMLAQANRQILRADLKDRINLVLGSAEDMPFAEEVFDTVTSTYCLGGIARELKALIEIARILQTEGMICLAEMTAPLEVNSRLRKWIHKTLIEPLIISFWEFRDLDLSQLLESAGFDIEFSEYRNDRLLGSTMIVRGRKHSS